MTDEQKVYEEKIEEFHSWNFTINVASSSFDSFGFALVGVQTVLPAYLSLFTQSNLIVGLLPATLSFFWTFPQIAAPLYSGHLRQKKNAIAFLRIGYALPWLVLGIVNLMYKPQGAAAIVLFFALYSVFAVVAGMSSPVWVSFLSRLIVRTRRGRFYATQAFIGTAFGILASFMVRDVLGNYAYPLNFSLIFVLAFSMFLLGIVFLAISKEPASPDSSSRRSAAAYWLELREIARSDKRFMWFIVSSVFRSFGAVVTAGAFYMVYAIRRHGVQIEFAGIFMGIMLGARLLGSPFLGYLSDRSTPWLIQMLKRVFSILGLLCILFWDHIYGVCAAFGFLGVAGACMNISFSNLVIDLAPKNKVDTYVGLVNSLRAPTLAVAPIVGGILADAASYQAVFWVCLCSVTVSAFILWLKVKPPRFVEGQPISG